MEEKQWIEYEQRMKKDNRVWANYNPGKCLENKPSSEDLFNILSSNNDEYWEKSIHPWCGSCYNSYIEVCSKIADDFDIYIDKLGHWYKEPLRDAINNFVSITDKVDPKEWIDKYEIKILNIIDCINMRSYHSKNCYKLKESKKLIPKDSILGDPKHIDFLKFLCRSLLKLIVLYEGKLYSYNQHYSNTIKPNILKDLNPYTVSLCISLFKNDKDLIEYVENTKGKLKATNKLKLYLKQDYNLSLEDANILSYYESKNTSKNDTKKILGNNNIKQNSKTPPKRKSKRKSKRS